MFFQNEKTGRSEIKKIEWLVAVKSTEVVLKKEWMVAKKLTEMFFLNVWAL